MSNKNTQPVLYESESIDRGIAESFIQHEGDSMRGTYEAYILVKVKGGWQYVCALNRPKNGQVNFNQLSHREMQEYLQSRVIWN
ncbi:MAG: hypothetical protein KJ630_20685 [Proteobacteria bacterium]|nr:hypothetical protein [Pseudomonadota bacterium]